MNKAFVREPEQDDSVYCPRCGLPGLPVGAGPLDTHVREDIRDRLPATAWYCSQSSCDVAYFTPLGVVVLLSELRSGVYPYDPDAPLCACFGLSYDDVLADVDAGVPTRIRQLLADSRTSAAACALKAVDGQCCLTQVQKLYLKLRGG